MKFQVLLFAGLCVVIGQAQAALFSDDEAHNQIRQLGERLSTLESAGKQQVETIKQQFHLISDLQTEIETQKTELRKLHGQNEERVHNLQNTEKRLTNLYSDHEKALLSLRGQYEKLMLNLQDVEKRQSEANKKQASFIQDQKAQLKVYLSKIEESSKQQAEASKNQVEIIKQQTSSLLAQQAQFNEHMSHLEENGKQQLNAMLDQQQAQFKIRISQLEEISKQQINSIIDQQQAEFKVITSRLEESGKQQTQAMLDLQVQIEAQNAEFRKLQGLNEDVDRRLQDANQRQKDVYTDLDTRVRHFETVSPLELQKQIQAQNEELHKLRSHEEEVLARNQQDMEKRLVEANKLQNNSMLDIQKNIEAQNTELRSQNEELMHNLQEIEKKQKNFNGDLNSRLRHVETKAVLDLKKKVEAQDDEANHLRDQNEELIHTMQELEKRQAEISKQQTSSIHKLQAQVDLLNMELRKLRSQNEDLLHNLQDAEKRQKDFYIDMDASLRHFESIVAGTSSAPSAVQSTKAVGGENAPPSSSKAVNGNALETDTVAMESRAYELAHGYVKTGNHQNAINAFQEFLKKYPESKHVANIHYEMGNAYFSLKDFKSALDSYQLLVSKHSSSPNVPDAMLGIADSQYQLKAIVGAKKTLNQIIAKYPGSKIADQAKKRLDTLK
ncbi:MAG: tol-pal system protein YbgF [Candidatus Nitrotoga sp.]